jgi:hypothetical protein
MDGGRMRDMAQRMLLASMALSTWWLSISPSAGTEQTCGQFKFCSRQFFANGTCDGKDQVPILAPAWEASPITIRGVTIGLQTQGRPLWNRLTGIEPSSYAFAGNSYVPDVMPLQVGTGTTTVQFPADATFTLPAKGTEVNPHIHLDAHVSCVNAHNYSVWLVVFYTLP